MEINSIQEKVNVECEQMLTFNNNSLNSTAEIQQNIDKIKSLQRNKFIQFFNKNEDIFNIFDQKIKEVKSNLSKNKIISSSEAQKVCKYFSAINHFTDDQITLLNEPQISYFQNQIFKLIQQIQHYIENVLSLKIQFNYLQFQHSQEIFKKLESFSSFQDCIVSDTAIYQHEINIITVQKYIYNLYSSVLTQIDDQYIALALEQLFENKQTLDFYLQDSCKNDELQSTQLQIFDEIQKQLVQISEQLNQKEISIESQNLKQNQNQIFTFVGIQKYLEEAFFCKNKENSIILNKIINQIQNINSQIYQQITKYITQCDIELSKMEFKGIYQYIYHLEVFQPLVKFVQVNQKYKKSKYFNQKLFELLNNNFKNYQFYKNKLQIHINNIESILEELWESQQYEEFVKVLNSIKYNENLNNKQTQSKYDENLKKYIKKVENQFDFITDLIDQKQFNSDLDKKIKKIELLLQQSNKNVKLHTYSEIVLKAIVLKFHILFQQEFDAVKIRIDSQFLKQFKKIETIGDYLIKIKKYSVNMPTLNPKFQDQIERCLNAIQVNESEMISQLAFYLQEHKSGLGQEIMHNAPHFKNALIQLRKNATKHQHNYHSVLKHIESRNNSTQTNYQKLNQNKQMILKDKYIKINQDFNKTMQEYIKMDPRNQRDFKLKIKQSIFQTFKFEFDINNWNSQMKERISLGITQLSSYWSISQLDFKFKTSENKEIYKELHATQIFTLMMLFGLDDDQTDIKQNFQNQLVQLQTGEGKSIILGFASTILGLMGYNVDVASYSYYLSSRDYADFKQMFEDFGLLQKIKYGTFEEIQEKIINQNIDIREETENLIKGKPSNQSNYQKQKKNEKQILLIDEVDVFIQSFIGKSYYPITVIFDENIGEIMKIIWDERRLSALTIQNSVLSSKYFTKLIEKFPSFQQYFKNQFDLMIASARKINMNTDTVKYVVKDNKIGYYEFDSISFSTYHGYLTAFTYFKENELGKISNQRLELIKGIQITCGIFSQSSIINQYAKILGVTGTLKQLHEGSINITNKFISKYTTIPSMFGNSKVIKNLKNLTLEKNLEDHFKRISSEIKEAIEKNRPVLVFFQNNEILYKYYNSTYLPVVQSKILILNQQENDKDQIVQQSQRKGQITFVVKEFGRGTDFICLDIEIDNQGGVLVIQTFFSKDLNEQNQVEGRTGRQGRAGEYMMILNREDLVEDFDIEENILEQNESDLYNFLDSERSQNWQKKVIEQQLKDEIKAGQRNIEALQYLEFIQKGKKQEAIDYLVKINQD